MHSSPARGMPMKAAGARRINASRNIAYVLNLPKLSKPCCLEAFVSTSNLAMGFSSLCLGQICFNQGIKCDSRCRCKDCGNQPTMEDDMKENPFRITIKVQPSAQFMVPPKVKNNEAMSPSLPGFEWHCNNAKSVTSAEISDHTLNDSVDHHEERATIAEAGTNDNYTTREDVERSCLRPTNENERNQSLRDKLTHRRKLLAFVRQSRVAAEERIHNILHEESDSSSLIIPRDEVVGVESSTLLDEADPESNDGTYPTQVHANEPDLESHTRLTWDDGLEQLKAFQVKFGHVDVPTSYTDQQNQPLRFFVRNIRKSYKNIQEGQTSENKHLSDQRISELERMGFKLQVQVRQNIPWEHRFEELRQHFRTHGNSDCPMNSVLRRWVHHQRSFFRMMLKGARNCLTEKRIGLLNSIGFDWRVVMKVQVPDQVSVNADQGRLCLMISVKSRSKNPIIPFISCSCSMRLFLEQCRTCRFIAKCPRTFKFPLPLAKGCRSKQQGVNG